MAYLVDFFSAFMFLILTPLISSQLDEFFYPGFKDSGTNITFSGVAEVQENGMLRLTNETSRLLGHAFYTNPYKFKNSSGVNSRASSFSTSFVFTVVPEYPKLGGHGLAFAIATTKDLNALPSQYLGLLNASSVNLTSDNLFAVEFDTVQDFEFGDINDNHVGIDINSLNSSASAAAAYYTDDSLKLDLNLKSGKPIQVWIDYDSVQNVVNVTLSPTSKKPNIPILTFDVDLSSLFQEYMYVGLSASTGLLASSHYVSGWSFKLNGQAQALDLSSLPSLPGPKGQHTGLVIGVSVAIVVLVIIAVSAAVVLIRKIKNVEVIEDWELEVGPHRYSYQELKKATNGFSDKELLGRGGFGQVYKGTLPNSKIEVAVKRISKESTQGLQEFVSEIASIGRLRHRNLVQLIGWCRRRDDFLLVYDYMANGSLDKFLFDEPEMVLNWEQRFKIIKDVASGLLYLHEGYEQVVIHRDVKASNVLLDSELNGRLGDFGLARLYEHGTNPNTTRVVGTLGYLAPEVSRRGKATASSDVYAFGALLLEVACGRRPIDHKALAEEPVLVDWVWESFIEGRILDVVDPKLNGQYNENEVIMVIKLGIMCSNNAPNARPTTRQVVRYLDEEIGMPQNLKDPSGGTYDGSSGKCTSEGFDDFVHLTSSSFDKMTTNSFDGHGGTSFASLSPLSLLHGRGENRQ